jgi:hypothetical protein
MANNAPVEAKVKASTAATFGASLVLAVLNEVVADHSLLGPLPYWLQAVLIAGAPPAVTYLAGWQARHTPRLPR